ncbi:MAG: glycosyltransferase, partial [Candidatus Eremiobacteraeota bacterium]|nr:glycosyltransferase [Candidatus Eremiobacteraeota bacterium]
MLRRLLRGIALTATIAGIGYLAVARRCVCDFSRRGLETSSVEPDVTVFKPLRGEEPQLYENLCSFCDQQYGDFRVIFGVADRNDPAYAVAERVRKKFPSRDIVLSVGADPSATNPKIANLIAMSAHARGEIFVIADSDMRVDRNYLRSIVAPFEDQRTGAVTCLYRAHALNGFSSLFGAMHVNAYFAPSVLVASRIEDLAFALGATIAVRKTVLDEIGGFT